MAYDGALLLASIILLVPILALAGIVHLVLRKLRFVPAGRAGLTGYALIVLGGYSLLFLYSAVQMLVIDPAQLQEEYLGRTYAGPLALRSYEHSGFQDPPTNGASPWTMARSPNSSGAACLRLACAERRSAVRSIPARTSAGLPASGSRGRNCT